MSCARGQKLKEKKTSTPEREENETLQCDLSMITPLNLTVPSNSVSTTAGVKSSKAPRSSLARSSSLNCLATHSKSKPEPASRKEETYTEEDLATAVSNANLQSQLMKYLVENQMQQMQKNLDEDLYRLQKEIEKEQEREKELKSRLKTIKINKEIGKNLNANEKTIEKLVENMKAAKVDENIKFKCEAISKELEKNEDRIICKNITIPESDESNEKLHLMIGETKEAYEELTSELTKQKIDENVIEALGKTQQSTEEFAERKKRCEEGLEELKTLIARENTLRVMVALEEMKKMNHFRKINSISSSDLR